MSENIDNGIKKEKKKSLHPHELINILEKMCISNTRLNILPIFILTKWIKQFDSTNSFQYQSLFYV